ncbi:MAG TPA: sigma-70 family RNA polymerase sigma factor [Firmicutes bacterium]|jgi:RNA polymerase sigma-70 factor (ECF subfamily)|nr:sigma-70 family RNA polymerase sigma factor [Bacillota bacterium]HOQ24918.1 sigma-70 family RNA polymerase sigma factor [Bacillota bacterium]HPT68309.1 sigma-70 family RNA polymerase sigma factor [Bacillota bacterium]
MQENTLSLSSTIQTNTIDQFESLIRDHEKALYHFAYRLTGDPYDAQDLLQEAFLKAYRSFHRFELGTSFDRWVYQITYRLFVDNYRKKRRRPYTSSLDEPIPNLDQDKTPEVADESQLPEVLTLQSELGQIIQDALKKIPAEFRAAVVLCDVQGFSYEEISQILRCSLGTVRSRIHRGRKLLRGLLLPYLREEGICS